MKLLNVLIPTFNVIKFYWVIHVDNNISGSAYRQYLRSLLNEVCSSFWYSLIICEWVMAVGRIIIDREVHTAAVSPRHTKRNLLLILLFIHSTQLHYLCTIWRLIPRNVVW